MTLADKPVHSQADEYLLRSGDMQRGDALVRLSNDALLDEAGGRPGRSSFIFRGGPLGDTKAGEVVSARAQWPAALPDASFDSK